MFRSQIQFPELRDEQITSYYAQIRPFRAGGLRIQRQLVKGKHIIHNYGHGGAGISLAPSSSDQAVSLSLDLLKPKAQVAIIGSGINGLMTAHFILEHEPSAKVTVYAEQVASYCNKNNKFMIASQIAPGLYMPYNYGMQVEEMHRKLSHHSYNFYKHLSQQPEYKNYIKKVDYFDLSDEQQKQPVTIYLTEDLLPSLRHIDVTINHATKLHIRAFKTYKLDIQPFQHIFKAELMKKGVKFVEKKLTASSLYELHESTIFNCSGIGSVHLFNDLTMTPKKGHLIEYQNLDPHKYDYILRINIGDKKICYYMHDSRILCGLTMKEDESREVDLKVIQEIKDIHKSVVRKLGLDVKAKL